MTNPDSKFKSIDITLPTKVHIVKTMVFLAVMYRCESWAIKKAELLLNCVAREDSWESLGQQGDQMSQSYRESTLNIHWKTWCWSWSSHTLATWWEEPTHWKKPWCWERLKAGGEREDRGWDGWMASLTQWSWVWASSVRRWRTGKPGVLQSMGSQRVGHNLVTEPWTTK